MKLKSLLNKVSPIGHTFDIYLVKGKKTIDIEKEYIITPKSGRYESGYPLYILDYKVVRFCSKRFDDSDIPHIIIYIRKPE